MSSCVGAETSRTECHSEARQKTSPPEWKVKAHCCQNKDISGDGVEILIGSRMRLCVPTLSVLMLRKQARLTTAIEARGVLYIAKVPYDLGALIEVQHRSTSSARGPTQACMQSTVSYSNDDAASVNPKNTGIHLKAPTVLNRHPQDKFAR